MGAALALSPRVRAPPRREPRAEPATREPLGEPRSETPVPEVAGMPRYLGAESALATAVGAAEQTMTAEGPLASVVDDSVPLRQSIAARRESAAELPEATEAIASFAPEPVEEVGASVPEPGADASRARSRSVDGGGGGDEEGGADEAAPAGEEPLPEGAAEGGAADAGAGAGGEGAEGGGSGAPGRGSGGPAADGAAAGGDAPGGGDAMAALATGDIAMIDTELAEHQRWGAAAARVGAAGSTTRADFIVAAAGAGALGAFGHGALMGAAMGAGTQAVELGVGRLVARLAGPALARSFPLPAIGAVIGGVFSAYDLATRDWGRTGETIGRFGEGGSIYEQLANSIAAVSEIIGIATAVLNVIAGVIGAISIAMWIITVLTVGVATPLAATLSTIAGAIGIATMILDGINALVLQRLVTLFRALHTFTSQADPTDVEAQGGRIGEAAGASAGFVGGMAGGLAGAGLTGAAGRRMGLGHEPPPRVPDAEPPRVASGDGPTITADPPPVEAGLPAGDRPAILPPEPAAPRPIADSAGPVAEGPGATVAAPEVVDPHAPTMPAPEPVDPHAPTMPAPEPVDPHAPTMPAPEVVDPHAPTALPEGGGMPEIPGPPRLPNIEPLPDYGVELPDWNPAEPSPYAPTERPPPIDPLAPTVPVPEVIDPLAPTVPAPEVVDPLAPTQRAPAGPERVLPPEPAVPEARRVSDDQRVPTPEEVRAADIERTRLETIGERRRMAEGGGLVDPEFQDLPDAPGRARRRGDPRPPDQSVVSDRVKADLRARARAASGLELQAALRDPGQHNTRTLAAMEFLTPEQLAHVERTGELPPGVQFHHMMTVADFPEFADRPDVGVPMPEDLHTQMGHGGDTTAPVEAATFRDPAAADRPPFHNDPQAQKYNRPRAADVAEGLSTSGDVTRDLVIERQARIRQLEGRARAARDPARAQAFRAEAESLRAEIETITQLEAAERARAAPPPAETPATDGSGPRRAGEGETRSSEPLTPEQFEAHAAMAESMGVPREKIQPSSRHTAYIPGSFDTLLIGPDIHPLPENRRPTGLANPANAALEPRAVLAHEVIGHREAELAGQVRHAEWLEEFQASTRAALHDPGLSPQQRWLLMQDAEARRRFAPNDDTIFAWTGRHGVPEAPSGPPTPRPAGHFRPQDQLPSVIVDREALVPAPSAEPAARIGPAGAPTRAHPVVPAARGASTPEARVARGGTLGSVAGGLIGGPGGAMLGARVGAGVARRAEDFNAGVARGAEPIVEPVNPAYPPPPGTGSRQELVDMQNRLLAILQARAQAEALQNAMAADAGHHEANSAPLADLNTRTGEAMTAAQAHQQATAQRSAANQQQQTEEGNVGSTLSDYGNRAAGLAMITGPLEGFTTFTSLAHLLPDDPQVLVGAKRGILRMNADGQRFLEALHGVDGAVAEQQGATPARESGIEANAGRLESTAAGNTAAQGQLGVAQSGGAALASRNDARAADSRRREGQAAATGGQLDGQAEDTRTGIADLSAQWQAWAQAHRQARETAIAQTREAMVARGWRPRETRPGVAS